jgi:hypothetical protein
VVRPGPDADPTHVLVLRTLGAPERRRLLARRARDAPPEPDPVPVTTTRATVIDAARLDDEGAAKAWLSGADDEDLVAEAVRTLNAALHAQRVAAADPYLREVSRDQALVVRVGYGAGEQVAEGRWLDAREAPPPRRRGRRAALSPQERVAALLGRRETPLACEELTLRARLDLDAGREREAVLQLRVALEAALAELASDATAMAERLGGLRERQATVAEAARAAIRGEPTPEQMATVGETLTRLEAALRARAAQFDVSGAPPPPPESTR